MFFRLKYKCTCNNSTNHFLLHLLLFTSQTNRQYSLSLYSFILIIPHSLLSNTLSYFSFSLVEAEMEKKMSRTTILFIFFFASVLVSHNLVIPVMCRSFEDQKTYYRHHPHAPSTPSTPSGSHHGSPSPHTPHPSTPHHGSSGNCGSPPSHVPTRPSPPRGGYYEPPPTTPVTPTPVTPTPVTPTPVTPTPVTPTPVTPTPVTPTPTIPVTPTIPGFPIPPITPIIPGFPIPPSTPFIPDPNSPPPLLPGTCSYWRSHPDAIFALVGFWGSIGSLFGIPSTPSLGLNPSLIQALSDPRTDGIGALYREGTASFLNSIANRRFPFTTEQVRNRFSNGLTSNKAATAQAQVFKLANEGRFKPRA